jgi:hypothetical protein
MVSKTFHIIVRHSYIAQNSLSQFSLYIYTYNNKCYCAKDVDSLVYPFFFQLFPFFWLGNF